MPRRLLAAMPVKGTIRTQILVCCLLMSAITAALGVYATSGIRHAADLVAKTFDESLMSINYARAAAADFSNMRAASSRRRVSTDPASRATLDKEIDTRGLNCPLPILKAKKALADLQSGQLLKVVATDSGSIRDFQAFAKQTGNELVEQQTVGNEFIHVLRRR